MAGPQLVWSVVVTALNKSFTTFLRSLCSKYLKQLFTSDRRDQASDRPAPSFASNCSRPTLSNKIHYCLYTTLCIDRVSNSRVTTRFNHSHSRPADSQSSGHKHKTVELGEPVGVPQHVHMESAHCEWLAAVAEQKRALNPTAAAAETLWAVNTTDRRGSRLEME